MHVSFQRRRSSTSSEERVLLVLIRRDTAHQTLVSLKLFCNPTALTRPIQQHTESVVYHLQPLGQLINCPRELGVCIFRRGEEGTKVEWLNGHGSLAV